MNDRPNRCPVVIKRLWCQIAKRLWCQLAISYTVLTFVAMMFLITLLYTLDDYNDFRAAVTPDNVENLVSGEARLVLRAIRDTDRAEWLDKARDSLRDKLINIERGSGTTIYRITNSSRPEVFIQIVDADGQRLLSDPGEIPPELLTQAGPDGPFLVDLPITDDNQAIVGGLRVLYVSDFDLLVQLQSIFGFLLHIWHSVLLCSIPIGIACGLMASRYVTRQLQSMNEVTERWRQGDFDARIALPNDDVLIRHSQHLNEMAQDLEMFLNLKQDLAVGNERNRVARELHDTVKQKLFALGLQLATAKSKPNVMEAAREPILEAEAITREAQHDLMEIITQLRPSGAGDSALVERLGTIADDFRRRFGIDVELDHSLSSRLDANAQHQVLRIVQEALMNAVRHGKASGIRIAGLVDHDIARMTIADNGAGFDPGRATRGFGITSMRDRARDLPGGTLDIASTEGAGTRITLSWRNEP